MITIQRLKTLNDNLQHTADAINERLAGMDKDLGDVMNNKWRSIVKIYLNDKDYVGASFEHDVWSENGGGTWAEAKINTMETYREYMDATLPMPIKKIIELAGDRDGVESLKEFTNVEELRREDPDLMHWVVDCQEGLGIAPGFGGVNIPFKCTFTRKDGVAPRMKGVAVDRNIQTLSGRIMIAFAGATDEQNLFFAFNVFKAMAEVADKVQPGVQVNYDISRLKEIPEINFWIKTLGIGRF